MLVLVCVLDTGDGRQSGRQKVGVTSRHECSADDGSCSWSCLQYSTGSAPIIPDQIPLQLNTFDMLVGYEKSCMLLMI
jgi:hypothetical protein